MPRPYLSRKCKKPYSNRKPAAIGRARTRSTSERNAITNRRAKPTTANMATPPSQDTTTSSPQLPELSTTATDASIANAPAGDLDDRVTIPRKRLQIMQRSNRILSISRSYHLEAQIHWDQLSKDISYFASDVLIDEISWEDIDSDAREMLTSWTPLAKPYLESPVLAKVIFEGWIWRILCRHIFEATGEETARNPLWRAYGTLLRFFDPTTRVLEEPAEIAEEVMQRYVLWRGLSTSLMEYGAGLVQHFEYDSRFDEDYVIQLITRELGPFIKAECTSNEGGWRAHLYQRLLKSMAKRAINADICIKRCVTSWKFDFVDPTTKKASGFPFQPNHWEVNEVIKNHYVGSIHFAGLVPGYSPEGAPVDFVVRPSLRIAGGVDIHDSEYETCDCCLAPMVVVVDQFPPGTEVLDVDDLIERRSKRCGKETAAEAEPEQAGTATSLGERVEE